MLPFAPVVIVIAAIPLILGLVPRNGLYGFRVAKTLKSDAVWYPANRIAGIALLLAGLVWIAAGRGAVPPPYVDPTGIVAVAIAVAVAFLYVQKL